MTRELLAFAASAVTFYAYLPYIRSIHAGITKPHVFSWIVWGIATCIVFAAQLAGGGGAGAWVTGISGAITLYVAWLAYQRRAEISVTRSDKVFLALALGSIPLWYITSDPLSAVVLLTTIDLFGYTPTFRKAYHRPFEEKLSFYALMCVRNAISILALAQLNLTTLLFPVATGLATLIFIILVASRRRVLTP